MSTTSSAMVRALKSKYGTPANVLRKLGLDAEMLGSLASPPPPPSPVHDDEDGDDRLKKFRLAVEKMLGELAASGALSDEKHAAAVQMLQEHCPDGHDAEPDDKDAEFREHLKRAGLGEDDIERACDIVRNATKGAKDFASGEPHNNFAIAGERGRGSELASDAALRRKYPEIARLLPSLPAQRPAPRLAADAARLSDGAYRSCVSKYGADFTRIRTG